MTSTQNGSIDGIRVTSYASDSEYDLTDSEGARSLANAFVNAGMAVEIAPNIAPTDKSTPSELIEVQAMVAEPAKPAKRAYTRKQA